MKKIKESTEKIMVVGYCRFSDESQREESIEGQKREIEKYANQNDMIIKEWYIDRAKTGTVAQRKDFQRMITDSKKKGFKWVLVYKFDRFARSKEDSAKYKAILKLNGVRVYSVSERTENTPAGKLVESMMEALAEHYIYDLAANVQRGMVENALKGKCNGGRPAFGYKRIPKLDEYGQLVYGSKNRVQHETVIHPENAEAVKMIFQMTIEGSSRNDIVDRLTELGFKDSQGRPFATNSIDHILRRERYTGYYKHTFNQGRFVKEFNDLEEMGKEDGLPQIISKETFQAVQQILAQRVHRSPRNTIEEYLLAGKVFCGDCGTTYTGQRNKNKRDPNGDPYIFYKCGWHFHSKGGRKVVDMCKNTSVRRDDLEKYVVKQIKKVIFHETIAEEVIEEYNKYAEENKSNYTYLEVLENKIKDIDKALDGIATAISMSGVFSTTLQSKLKKLEEERKETQDLIEKEKTKSGYLKATRQELQEVYDKAQRLLEEAEFEERKAIINWFVNKIIVYKERVEIFINLIPITLKNGINLEIGVKNFIEENNEVEHSQSEIDSENEVIPVLNDDNPTKKGGLTPPSSVSNDVSHVQVNEFGCREKSFGDPYGNRTRDVAVKGRCDNRFTKGP